jgi:CDP-diacylglycerol--glycerol-3-phosphate 3-phosphatidyltransferase
MDRRLGLLNIPNRITLGRLLLSVVLFVLLAGMQTGSIRAEGLWGWVALVLFVITAASDFIDGWLARKLGMVTAFGRIMDPFVDKVVVCGAFVFLCAFQDTTDIVPPWMVVVILAREFFVNAIRGFMESRGVSFGAEMPGKIKMILQCVAIGSVLLFMALGARTGESWAPEILARVAVWAALVSTVSSGWFYARKAFGRLAGMDG